MMDPNEQQGSSTPATAKPAAAPPKKGPKPREPEAPAIEITPDRLALEQGFPLKHTEAFRETAREEQCVILTRTPGPHCEGLLREGYTAKSFHVKAKSCDWGAMAGFLCLEPMMTKKGKAGVGENLHANGKSLTVEYDPGPNSPGRTSTVVPAEISDARLEWLLRTQNLVVSDRSAKRVVGAFTLADDKTVTIDYLLARTKDGKRWAIYYDLPKLYGLKGPVGADTAAEAWSAISALLSPEAKASGVDYKKDFDVYWQKVTHAAKAPPPADAVAGLASAERYVPCLAMSNPNLEYDAAGPYAYLNAVTGDYDLFAVWPRHYDRLLDARVAGQNVSMTDQDVVDAESKSAIGRAMGNISERVQLIGQLINCRMPTVGSVQSNRVLHSDEGGRPFIDEVDEAAVFAPDGKMYMSKHGGHLSWLVRHFAGLHYTIFCNKAWMPRLQPDVAKFVTWGESLAEIADRRGLPEAKTNGLPPTTAVAIAERDKSLFERSEAVRQLQTENQLRLQEQTLRQQAYLQNSDDDERLRILEAVRITLPDITGKIGSDMKDTALKSREFAATEKTTLLDTRSATVTDDAKNDFFRLTKVERDDLLDRVGFYRGLVIDHSQAEIVQQGFRDVLKRRSIAALKDANDNGSDETAWGTRAVQVLYRKPKFSGYFDSSYTFSEAVHQVQTNGVTNLSFTLAAAGGVGVKWGVGLGYGYSSQKEARSAELSRRVYITTNYYIPKIELSFDYMSSCASDAFVEAVKGALAIDDSARSVRKLLAVLRAFGQFVPTRYTVGGKLYATQQKTLASSENASDETTRHAAAAKVLVKSMVTTVEASATAEKSDRKQEKAEATNEAQAMSFTAVGGEGSVLQNASGWANSLNDFKRWSTVIYDSPVTSISLLPDALHERCMNALRRYCERHTIRQILEDGGYFLFYGDYASQAGRFARRVEFYIRSAVDQRVVTLERDEAADGCAVLLHEYKGWDKQVWYMTPEGHIVSRVTRNGAEFALALIDLNENGQTVIYQKDRTPNQLWEFTGGGTLVNLSAGPQRVLAARGSNGVALVAKSPTAALSQVWDFIDLTPPTTPTTPPTTSTSTSTSTSTTTSTSTSTDLHLDAHFDLNVDLHVDLDVDLDDARGDRVNACRIVEREPRSARDDREDADEPPRPRNDDDLQDRSAQRARARCARGLHGRSLGLAGDAPGGHRRAHAALAMARVRRHRVRRAEQRGGAAPPHGR